MVAVAEIVTGLLLVTTSCAGQADPVGGVRPGRSFPGQPRDATPDWLAVTGPGVPPALLDQVRSDAADALRHVRGVWDGPWSDHVVVDVPADGAGFRARAGRVAAAGEAAVAVAPLPGAAGSGSGLVILNREVYEQLSAQGRQVVLRHELTHLASAGATGRDTPLWLVEGLAETVGHAGVELGTTRAAAELAAQVRSGRLPDTLPGDAAFAAGDGTVPATYQEAWLACRLIAERLGLDGLINFYRRVGSGDGSAGSRLAAAFRVFLDTTEAGFVIQWRSYLAASLSPP